MSFKFSGTPYSKQILSVSLMGEELKGEKTLSEYNIQKKSEIFLRLVGQFRVFVKTLFCKEYIIVVNASDTVEILKAKVGKKTGKVLNL